MAEGIMQLSKRNRTVADVPTTEEELAALLKQLHGRRRSRKVRVSRRALPRQLREAVLAKTGGRCHVCGGEVGADWAADHVLAHVGGGRHAVDNYLAAHRTCNTYRWHYMPEEFEFILKLGVWTRTQVERRTGIGQQIGDAFVKHERSRQARRSPRRV